MIITKRWKTGGGILVECEEAREARDASTILYFVSTGVLVAKCSTILQCSRTV